MLPAHAGRVVAELSGVVHRRAEPHDDAVGSRAERIGHIETVLNQHVRRVADLDAIHPDGRDRVKTGEDELPASRRGVQPDAPTIGHLELSRVYHHS